LVYSQTITFNYKDLGLIEAKCFNVCEHIQNVLLIVVGAIQVSLGHGKSENIREFL